jgi:hypothetical protein
MAGCLDLNTFMGAIGDLIGTVGTKIDYKLQRTQSYDPATGTVTKLETEYKDVPAIIMTHEVATEGSMLDQESHKGMVVISASSLSFFPSPGDLMEIPAASVRGANPFKVARVTDNTPMYVGANPVQYTLLWQQA